MTLPAPRRLPPWMRDPEKAEGAKVETPPAPAAPGRGEDTPEDTPEDGDK